MSRSMPFLLVALFLTSGHTPHSQSPQFPSHPDFKPTPEAPAMPKALMKFPRTPITRAKYPVVDFHFHGRALKTTDDYQKMVKVMDETDIGVICNMDGGFGSEFDRTMKVGEPFRDRIVQFARLDFDGINEPGWSAKTAAELERDFLAGAAGLKINKVLGLDLQNTDGSYIQADDKRFDPVWEMCARHNKPVMIHISDSYGRFFPIGTDNERYEAGLWRSSPEGNYYKTGQPTPDVIEKARENMHRKHPKTRFVLKYQNRILFGSDGNPGRGVEEFWVPHWRFLETYDEHFDHPAQLRSPTGAPLHGRWRIYGIGLPDDVLRKVYYANALRYLPSARASIEKQLARIALPRLSMMPPYTSLSTTDLENLVAYLSGLRSEKAP